MRMLTIVHACMQSGRPLDPTADKTGSTWPFWSNAIYAGLAGPAGIIHGSHKRYSTFVIKNGVPFKQRRILE